MKKPKKQQTSRGTIAYVGPLYYQILKRNGGQFDDSTDEQIVHAFAAWYAAKCANTALAEVPGQVTLEGETDTTVDLRRIVDGCLLAYGLDPSNGDTMGAVMALMPLCRRRAFMNQSLWSDRFQAWLDSAGRSYNKVTREPDAI